MNKLITPQLDNTESSPSIANGVKEKNSRVFDMLRGLKGRLLVAAFSISCASCSDVGDFQCKPFPDTDNLGDSDSDVNSDEIPASTIPILIDSLQCDSIYRDEKAWCDYLGWDLIACDGHPPSNKDECLIRMNDCFKGKFRDDFYKCVDALPLPSDCELQPFSNAHDTDGDGLPDHSELWHLHTNPCEPCSYGTTEPCDADADHDNDGIPNKEDFRTIGGCISHIPTDECG